MAVHSHRAVAPLVARKKAVVVAPVDQFGQRLVIHREAAAVVRVGHTLVVQNRSADMPLVRYTVVVADRKVADHLVLDLDHNP